MAALLMRRAGRDDLEAIIRLHEEDELGAHGDAWTPANVPAYEKAFAAIGASPDNLLFVAVAEGVVVGTFQLTFIPNLTGRGALRVKVESVKVRASERSQGIGARMMAHAEEVARQRGAAMLELTSNKTRKDAHRFYERIGFSRSHEGFKKKL
ncbi:GNAT family N-acetyltransferase [Microvirga flavescens]|uniref:GNAT family N-acetyltransferase n=1 Tax=Microvirga flavescens TaxID=2249811 RepID=UPI000DDA56DB|nr:GNAT family N-acetyltransferase [Microvirga flavescens]